MKQDVLATVEWNDSAVVMNSFLMHLRLDLLLEAFMSSSNEQRKQTLVCYSLFCEVAVQSTTPCCHLPRVSLSRAQWFFSIEVCDDLVSVNSIQLELNRGARVAHLQHLSHGER